MALTLSEQLDVQAGTLKPAAVEDMLIDLAAAAATNFARDFNVSYKSFDGEANPEAQGYLNKMLAANNRALRADSAAAQSLNRVISSLIADVEIATPAIIEAATQEQWFAFVNDNIEKAVELFAAVLIAEKTAYEALD